MGARTAATVAFVLGLWGVEGQTERVLSVLFVATVWTLWAPRILSRELQQVGVRWILWAPALCLGIGLVRGGAERAFERFAVVPPPGDYRELSGTVMEPPRLWGGKQVFPFRIDSTVIPSQLADRVVWVEWQGATESLHPGERWELSGRLTSLQESSFQSGFCLRRWLRGQGISERLWVSRFAPVCYLGPPEPKPILGAVHWVRYRFALALERDLGRAPRALVKGVLFGDTSELEPAEKELFRVTGTSHATAASGFHLALLLGGFWLIARALGYGPWRWAWAATLLVGFYAGLAGFSPSICRAGAAATAYLVSLRLGRPTSPYNALLVGLWGLLLWRPLLLYEVGFQLSICAVLGLLSTFRSSSPTGGLLGLFFDAWRAAIAATMATLPVVWNTFGELPVAGLVANLLIAIPVKALMIVGALEACLPGLPLEGALELITWVTLETLAVLGEAIPTRPLPETSPCRMLSVTVGLLLWFLASGGLRRGLGLALVGAAVAG